MARELTGGLLNFLQSGRGANFASWCVLTLPEVPGSPSAQITGKAYHLATKKLTIDGVAYDPSLREVGQIKRTVNRAAEQITVSLENVSTTFGALLLKDINVLHGATVRVGRHWHDPQSGARWSKQLFVGVVDAASGDEQNVVLRCLSDYYAVRAVGGGRAVELQCQAVFNSPAVRATGSGLGDACGYTGTDLTCDKLKATCNSKSNLFRFQGFVNIESAPPVSNTVNQPAPNYSLIQESDGTAVAPATALKFQNATVSTSGGVTTVTPTLGDGYFVDNAPYNAAGDGSTDDTSAIQDAIDDAYTAGGGTVYLGEKTYKCSALVIKDKVTIRGANWRKSILYSTSNAKILYVSTTAFDASVQNLTIKGTVTAGTSQIGLEIEGNAEYWGFTLRDVWIEDCGDHGLYIGQNPFSMVLDNIHITNCADYPFLFNFASTAPGFLISNSYAHTLRSGGGVGFRLKRGKLTMVNCNGIDNAPALSGSKWAVVGRKNGVDGDATDAGAQLVLRDCNIESFHSHGIHLYSSSFVSIHGKSQFAGGNSGSQKAIEFDLAGDGSSYFSQFISRSFIEDTVDFADGAAAYTNSQPIHANGFAPLQIAGQGPFAGGSGNAKITSYRNNTASATERLARADGNFALQTISATTTINQPGVRYIEVNNTSGAAISITLPWAGWYARAQEAIFIKDTGANAATYNITLQSGGGGTVNGGSFTMNKNGQAVVLVPDGNTGAGDWRVLSSYPEYKLISEAGSNVAIEGTLSATDAYVEGYSASASSAPGYYRRRHRGSSGSPAAVQSGDTLAYDGWQGQYDTTVGHRQAGAYLYATATENWDSTHAGTKVVISVAPNASTDAFNKKWEFDGDNGFKRPDGTYIQGLQAARVYRSTTQSVNNITWSPVSFDAETRDDGGFHSTSSNVDRLTVPATGWYQLSANIEFAVNNTGCRMVRFFLNGTTEIARAALASIATYPTYVPLTATYYLTAADYVTCDVFQDSGGNLNVGTGSFYQIHRVY